MQVYGEREKKLMKLQSKKKLDINKWEKMQEIYKKKGHVRAKLFKSHKFK